MSLTLRLCHLYPGEMNIYADRGNIAVLERRLAWRGLAPGGDRAAAWASRSSPGAHDLYYLGGGQDRDQAVVAEDLVRDQGRGAAGGRRPAAPRRCACAGASSSPGTATPAPTARGCRASGILDLDTVAGPTRLIGNLVIEAELDGERRRVVGFENHAGRTRLGPGSRPARPGGARPRQQRRGRRRGRRDGPGGRHLPPRAAAAEEPLAGRPLIGWGLAHRTGAPVALEPLDDALEEAAHAAATARAAGR